MLDNLKLDDTVENQDEDFVPGNDYTMPTGLVPMIIEQAWMGESLGGSVSVTAWFKEVNGKRTLRETFYVTTKKDADGNRRNTYKDKRSGKPRPLPGMASVNGLTQVACGLKLHQLTPEKKFVAIYNFDERKDVATEVPALTEIIGKPVLVAVVRKRDNKSQLVNGKYVPTPKERITNESVKFLYPTGLTVAETVAGKTEPAWRDQWAAKHDADYVDDSYVEVAPGNAAVNEASAEAAADTAGEVEGLFSSPASPAVETAPVAAAPVAEAPVAAAPVAAEAIPAAPVAAPVAEAALTT